MRRCFSNQTAAAPPAAEEPERQNWGPCECGWSYEAGYLEGHETWCQCQCWDCQATNTQANNPQDDNDGSDWSGYGSDKSDEIWGNEPAVRTKLGESGNEFEVASDHLISSTIQEYLPTPCTVAARCSLSTVAVRGALSLSVISCRCRVMIRMSVSVAVCP